VDGLSVSEGAESAARRTADRWDWAATPLGPVDQWPARLTAAWDLVVDSVVPMALLCGPQLLLLYNDAFADLLGHRHPKSFARPAREVLGRVWSDPLVGRPFEATMHWGTSFLQEAAEIDVQPLSDRDEEHLATFVRAGSPVRDEDGRVLAVLHLAVDTTATVGRSRAVARLATSLAVAVTVDDVCKVVLREAMVAFDALSVTFCLPSPGPSGWRMARRHRVEELSPDEERLPLIWSEVTPDLAALVDEVTAGSDLHVQPGGETVAMPLREGEVTAALVIHRQASAVPRDVLGMAAPFRELVAEALRRAVVYDAERSTAELLQRTLLPPNLPQSDQVSIAARYEPVSEGTVAGGDFYDSFFLPDGRLALVIGDVAGRGVMAATVMGQVRAAIRGAALTDPSPATVMAALDRVVTDLNDLWPASMPLGTTRARPGMSFGGELFVTLLYGAIDPSTGDLQVASAGHPPPALLAGRESRADGIPRGRLMPMDVGPPLGIPGERPVARVRLTVGDMLLAYTDGLLERRGISLEQSEAQLVAVLGAIPPSSPRRVAQFIVDAMLETSGQEDDCAVLAVGRSPAGYRRVAIVVPPLPESVRAAREWARRELDDWAISESDQHTVITGISELITNSVLHAGTESHLSMDLDSGVLTVTVSDSGNRGEPLLTGADPMAVRGRGLSLVKAISDAFGVHRTSAGTTVWFEVEVQPSMAPPVSIRLA
jgi:serine phosphatase RsbU (regulator of sigma subunit)/anti-sigma regulatory factor (Ser/Thr protein kinase)